MTREEMRKAMPICTAFIDDLRQAFGRENIVGIHAEENGLQVEWGTPKMDGEKYQAEV